MASSDDTDQLLIGVQARIEDAGVLADAGRYEGALLMLLVAVAATSRKRYPRGTGSMKHSGKQMGDREAFTTFLRDEMWRLVREHDDSIHFSGQKRPIEAFLYEILRCKLVHEGHVPVDLYPMRDSDILTIVHPDGSGVSFSRLLLTRLNDVVWRAPENSLEAVQAEMEAIRARRADYVARRTS
jgi:hypothetical protein